ncbi:MAG TPA: aminotransferase class III-fold pyridoxal phosphate-dependent enzyme [Candidatus Omnitrophota bacterium]|nr:aminotransferase class III-fold pyridoxal phosphate-dependent enzyme [Candidatus Omnitrophota bacterium]
MKTLNSRQLCRQSRKIYPDAAQSSGQAFEKMGVAPLFFRTGRGALLYDQDDNAFTDYDLCGGTLILGHGHRNVVLAVKKAAEYGIHFGLASKAELDLAQEILKAFPRLERITFRPSAGAALQEALRLARAFTGRPLAVILDARDEPGSSSEGGLLPMALSTGCGQGEGLRTWGPHQMILSCGSMERVEAALDPFKTQLACVVAAPLLMGDDRVAVMEQSYLKDLRALTRKYKCLLVVNEIDSGFRFHKGGLQERLGTHGDLTCLGKIIGGGFPLGAVGGRRDILSQGTCGGPGATGDGEAAAADPVIMRAGLATLRLLHNDVYQALERRAANLADGLNDFFSAEGLPVRAWRSGSLLKLQFNRLEPQVIYPALFQFLLNNKILWPPDACQPFSLCAMHRAGDCDRLAFLLKKFFQKAP